MSRLKPTSEDPLQAVGLPSKGDTSLNSPAAQERYFSLLRSRWRAASLPDPLDDTLHARLNQLALNAPATQHPDIPVLLHATRKLRESLLATHRTDAFALSVYLFTIRGAIGLAAHDAYHPPLQRVLRSRRRLVPAIRAEMARYAVLDAAGRQSDMAEALALLWRLGAEGDSVLRGLLRAHVRGDVLWFWRCWRRLEPRERILAGPLEERANTVAVNMLAKGYFTVDAGFAARMVGGRWEESAEAAGWSREGDVVVVRRRKGK